jgi:hypothetical protein
MRRLLVVAAVAGLAVAGTATAAYATPSNCTLTRGAVTCPAGTGSYRAAVTCLVKGEYESDHYGPWVGIGTTSRVGCPGGTSMVDWWYEVA